MMNRLCLLSTLALLAACAKDKTTAPINLDGQYLAANTITATPIVMYTRNGAIDNQQLIDRFLNRKQLSTPSFFRNDVTSLIAPNFTIVINGNSKAIINYQVNSNRITESTEITTKTHQYFVLANNDSINIGPFAQSLYDMQEDLVVIKRMVRCNPTLSYTTGCIERPFRVISIRDNKLFLPIFAYLIQPGSFATTATGLTIGSKINIFNPDVVSQLAMGDTIVVQTREVALLKQ